MTEAVVQEILGAIPSVKGGFCEMITASMLGSVSTDPSRDHWLGDGAVRRGMSGMRP